MVPGAVVTGEWHRPLLRSPLSGHCKEPSAPKLVKPTTMDPPVRAGGFVRLWFRIMILTFAMVGLGVYAITRFIDYAVEAPEWFVPGLYLAFGCMGIWLAGESAWWGFTVAGFAYGWQLLAEVILYVRDWVKLVPLRQEKRR